MRLSHPGVTHSLLWCCIMTANVVLCVLVHVLHRFGIFSSDFLQSIMLHPVKIEVQKERTGLNSWEKKFKHILLS